MKRASSTALHRPFLHRPLTFGLLSAAVLTGAALLADAWVGRREADRIHPGPDAVPGHAFAIVPGAAVRTNGRPSDALEDRLACALDLWRAGKVRTLLVSGNPSARGDEVACMSSWLRGRGVPDDAIVADREGFRTLDTMRRAAGRFGVRDAVLCTQAFHLPRALWLARRAGIDADGLVADRRPYANAWRDRAREVAARTRAVIDVWVLRAMEGDGTDPP